MGEPLAFKETRSRLWESTQNEGTMASGEQQMIQEGYPRMIQSRPRYNDEGPSRMHDQCEGTQTSSSLMVVLALLFVSIFAHSVAQFILALKRREASTHRNAYMINGSYIYRQVAYNVTHYSH